MGYWTDEYGRKRVGGRYEEDTEGGSRGETASSRLEEGWRERGDDARFGQPRSQSRYGSYRRPAAAPESGSHRLDDPAVRNRYMQRGERPGEGGGEGYVSGYSTGYMDGYRAGQEAARESFSMDPRREHGELVRSETERENRGEYRSGSMRGTAPSEASEYDRYGHRVSRRTGPKGYQRSDERIREDICERLAHQHTLDVSEVAVSVNGGIVTLDGHVNDRAAKYEIEDIADDVYGVRDVINQVRVHRFGVLASE